ncbi:MAG: hypothetical protein B7Z48_05020, partial [Thiotrichales bacterium 12-47-6]
MSQPCYHCGQPIAETGLVSRAVAGESRDFCCHGCAGACEAIYEAGLSSFYDKAEKDEARQPVPVIPKDLAMFDHDEVQGQFVDISKSVREIELIAEGIHCAACVWLIEHRLAKESGIVSAYVNFTTRRIRLKWNNNLIQ